MVWGKGEKGAAGGGGGTKLQKCLPPGFQEAVIRGEKYVRRGGGF